MILAERHGDIHEAMLIINAEFKGGTPDKMLFGSFEDHIRRRIYGGIYEPNHKLPTNPFSDKVFPLLYPNSG